MYTTICSVQYIGVNGGSYNQLTVLAMSKGELNETLNWIFKLVKYKSPRVWCIMYIVGYWILVQYRVYIIQYIMLLDQQIS